MLLLVLLFSRGLCWSFVPE